MLIKNNNNVKLRKNINTANNKPISGNCLNEYIQLRISYLEELIQQKEISLKDSPAGFLKGNKHKNGWQYYYRKDKQEKNGVYIPSEKLVFAKALGQKNYDEKVLEAAKAELKYLQKYENIYNKKTVEQIYQSIPLSHQILVQPIELPDDVYIQQWLSDPYIPKTFDEDSVEYYTEKGERVRSKSEVLIANLLARNGIIYKYEKPLYLNGYGTIYPDFTILKMNTREEVYYEHFGMLDDREYRDHALAKISLYEQNELFLGERLFFTYETLKRPLNMKSVERLIQRLK